jgi:type IV pilus assembly protein PilQ
LRQADRLLDVTALQEEEGTRCVLLGDGALLKYQAFELKNPPRIVVDVHHVSQAFRDQSLSVKSREISKVRVGRYPEKVRLVFDVAGNAMPKFSLSQEGPKLVLRVGNLALREERAAPSGPAHSAPEESVAPELPAGSAGTPAGEVVAAPEAEAAQREATPMKEEPPVPTLAAEASPRESVKSGETQSPRRTPFMRKAEEKAADSALPEPLAEASPMNSPPNQGGGELPVKPRTAPRADADLTRPEHGASKSEPGRAPGAGTRTALAVPQGAKGKNPTPFAWERPGVTQGVTLAQIASKAPVALPKAPAASAAVDKGELEDEEEFKISTGMEPGKVYTGQRVDLDFQDIDLDNVFRLLAEVSNLNILVSDKVKGKVTMRLKNVPWDQALDLVLSTQKLGAVRQGNVIRIAPLKDLADEEKERKKIRQERIQERLESAKRQQEAEIEKQERERKLRPFSSEFIVLNYTKAKDFQSQIQGMLTKEPKIERVGAAVVDERTNTVTVRDYPETIQRIKDYRKQVDRPTPQVLIEARIVKAAKNFARELGIQWGGQFTESQKIGDGEWAMGVSSAAPGAPFPSTFRSSNFTGGTGNDLIPLSGWMVNLPATLIPGPPGIGFQIGRIVGDLINLDVRLSVAEREGLTKIISRPKIMTLDNVEATIKQGREIPFTQVNPEGNVSVVYKEASLKTTVTPLISPDGRVRLKLDVTDDFPDRANANPITGNPEIVKRQSTTEVLVSDGETVVIGGVLEETRATSEDGVPWLKDIPGLSWLFERKSRRADQTELLIFVTPFVVQQT